MSGLYTGAGDLILSTGLTAAQPGWLVGKPYLPGHQAFALISAGRGAHRHDESLPGSSRAGPSPPV